MVTELILSFFGASGLASLLVVAACVASARATQIEQHALGQALTSGEQFAGMNG